MTKFFHCRSTTTLNEVFCSFAGWMKYVLTVIKYLLPWQRNKQQSKTLSWQDCRGHDGVVVVFSYSYVISAYHNYIFLVWFPLMMRCTLYCIPLYVIKFVCDLQHVCGFLWLLLIYSNNKTGRYDITEIIVCSDVKKIQKTPNPIFLTKIHLRIQD
jgi:hypothetical protein